MERSRIGVIHLQTKEMATSLSGRGSLPDIQETTRRPVKQVKIGEVRMINVING